MSPEQPLIDSNNAPQSAARGSRHHLAIGLIVLVFIRATSSPKTNGEARADGGRRKFFSFGCATECEPL
jgi:hypothetical protein